MKQILIIFISALFLLSSCKKEEEIKVEELVLLSLKAGTVDIAFDQTNTNIPYLENFSAEFNYALDTNNISEFVYLRDDANNSVRLTFHLSDDEKSIEMTPKENLLPSKNYFFVFSQNLKGSNGEVFRSKEILFTTDQGSLILLSASLGEKTLMDNSRVKDCPRELSIKITFNKPLNKESITANSVRVVYGGNNIPLIYSFEDADKTLIISSSNPLVHLQRHLLDLSNGILGVDASVFAGFSKHFYTELDTVPKYPLISDEELLTLIQRQTFKYFWDFGHPVSGMARERNTSGDVVTTGGTGFGIMAIPVAIERGFISRSEGIERIEKIVNFLNEADRFHGAWSHWLNGSTGQAIAFSQKDNGGDLVETSFLVQSLLSIRQYLNPSDTQESDIISMINKLWEEVEWTWYTRDQNVLYWHWSPNYEWDMNMQIRGYSECLITYILAASSPTYPISAEVYHSGWAGNGQIINGNSYYGIELPVGYSYGGPLFFAHYSFMGLDPRNLQDNYANYWTQNTHHSLINHAYCEANPKSYVGYSSEAWGLTASDNQNGYSAHSPTNDLGVITPTAALSSLPYSPEQSMKAIRFFYYTIGDKLWGDYGFYDAYNITESWVASSYLAIDQGPIIVMIENHRTGLLWNLFMTCPEINTGLEKLSFSH